MSDYDDTRAEEPDDEQPVLDDELQDEIDSLAHPHPTPPGSAAELDEEPEENGADSGYEDGDDTDEDGAGAASRPHTSHDPMTQEDTASGGPAD